MQVNNTPQKGWPEGWLIAAAAAVLAAVLSRVMGDVGLIATLFIGAFVFLVFGVLLGMFWGNPLPPPVQHAAHDHGHDHHPGHGHPAAPVAMAAQQVNSVSETATAVEAHRAARPVLDLPVVDAAPIIAAAPLAAPIIAAAVVASAPRADEPVTDTFETAPAATTEPSVATEPAAAHAGVASKPEALPGPRTGTADKLQVIEGIGPAMEKLCHDLGIYHFDQIAGWGAAEVAWMDSNLKGFKGRVTRDRWVAQAKLIGEVGTEDFARRAKTNIH